MTSSTPGIKEEEVFSRGILLHVFPRVALITWCLMSLSSCLLFLATVGADEVCLVPGWPRCHATPGKVTLIKRRHWRDSGPKSSFPALHLPSVFQKTRWGVFSGETSQIFFMTAVFCLLTAHCFYKDRETVTDTISSSAWVFSESFPLRLKAVLFLH